MRNRFDDFIFLSPRKRWMVDPPENRSKSKSINYISTWKNGSLGHFFWLLQQQQQRLTTQATIKQIIICLQTERSLFSGKMQVAWDLAHLPLEIGDCKVFIDFPQRQWWSFCLHKFKSKQSSVTKFPNSDPRRSAKILKQKPYRLIKWFESSGDNAGSIDHVYYNHTTF